MKYKIIFRIYTKVIFLVLNLYLQNIAYIYYILSLSLNFQHYYSINISNSSNLLFNIYLLYNLQEINQYTQIKKIQLRPCNNYLFKNFFLHKLKIKTKELKNLKFNKISSIHINELQKTGWLYSIKSFNIYIQREKYNVLYLKFNPLLKKIKIKNYHKLQIPKNILINLFKQQLGLPKNYKQIKQSLKKLNLWYIYRGFDYIKIDCIYKKKLNQIDIQIYEGKIKYSKLICRNIVKTKLQKKVIDKLNALIKKELNILPGDIFNTQKLEAGIIKLKNKYLINNLNYYTQYNNKELFIIIKYSLIERNKIFLYNKNIISIDSYNYLSLFQLFNKQIFYLNLLLKSILLTPKKILYSNLIYLYNYLNYKYCFSYISEYIGNCIIDMQINKILPQINIFFSLPYIKLYNNVIINFLFNIYYKIYKLNIFHIFIANSNINYNKIEKFESNLINKSYCLKLKIQYDFLNHIKLKQKIITTYNKYYRVYCYFKKYNKNIYINNKQILKFKRIRKNILRTLIYYQMSLEYYTFPYLNQVKEKQILNIEYQLLSYINRIELYKLNIIQYYSQLFKIEYQNVIKIPKIINYKHYLIICSKSNIIIGKNNDFTIFNEYYVENKNTNLILNDKKYKPLYIFKIEYQIHMNKYNIIYIFLKYIRNSYKNDIFLIDQFYYYNNKIKIVLGTRINIPIKQAPSIYIEYGINYQHKTFIHIGINSHYNE
uniref:POTRA domain-containing protein n=1 Tax=Inkyuleea mariana TaxID=123988 RepID=A0A4D6WZR9_9FLOR|nr:hypothetical protein [Inkyuleea mariana]